MLYLTGGCGSLAGKSPDLGVMVGPRSGGLRAVREGRRWAGDNDAFHGRFTEENFARHLARLMPFRETCLFVAAPDVVGDYRATRALYDVWAPRLHELGFPVAWVAQNGAQPKDIPGDCDAVFIGGCTQWKLGEAARAIVTVASQQGRWTHMGRVNSARRLCYAASCGVNSVDGTYTAYTGTERGLAQISRWLEQAEYAAPALSLSAFHAHISSYILC